MFAICAIFKNEAPYLRDWLTFHSAQGFDTFYLYNNNSTDDFLPALEGFNVVLTDMPGEQAQMAAYLDCINKNQHERWMAFIDLDEYLFSQKTRITTQLMTFEKPTVAGVGVNWIMYGDNDKKEYEDKPVIERFTKRAESVNPHIKTILRPSLCNFTYITPHYFKPDEGFFIVNENMEILNGSLTTENNRSAENLRLNHYFTKSEQEWKEKIARGRADTMAYGNRKMEEFYIHQETSNEITDLSAIEALNAYKVKHDIKVFQIHYDEESKANLDPLLIPYENKNKDKFFENGAILDIYNKNIEAEYIGVTSWRMKEKTNLYAGDLYDHIDRFDCDVLIYSPKYEFIANIPNGEIDIWKTERKERKDIFKAAKLLNESGVLPFDFLRKDWTNCFCNYWVARKEIYYDYCKTVLKPVLEWMKKEEKMLSKFKYSHREGKKYPIETFVLEGLFGSYLSHKNVCIKNVEQRFDYNDQIWHDKERNIFRARIGGVLFDCEVNEDRTLSVKSQLNKLKTQVA